MLVAFRTAAKTVAHLLEIFLAFMMLVVVVISIARMVMFEMPYLIEGNLSLEYFLAHAMNFAIGVEFVKMLYEHTSETLIEVLMFAIAREMIVEHLSPLNTLISIAAIAGLFAIRKFLFIRFEDTDRMIFRGSQKVSLTNRLIELHLPDDGKSTLRDLMNETLESEGRTAQIGTVVDLADCALRVDSMRDGVITRVEIIRAN